MKKTAIVSLIVLFLAAGVSAYFYYQWRVMDNFTPSEDLFASPQEGSPNQLGKIQTGKVFISEDKHFQLNYPEGWSLAELNSQKSVLEGKKADESWCLTSYSPKTSAKDLPSGSVKMDFEVSSNKDGRPLEEIIPCEEAYVLECRETKINGAVFRKVVVRLPSGGKSITLATIRNDKIYLAVGYPTPGDKEEEGIQAIEAVAATFKILD